ncbi:hypothetical protein A2V80_00670 [Candidatus Woesebacteria bacterium RBG_16_39_8b]|uniref:Uncharacterized protein n=1 Tax=Candidatus Woesebacteria bacterium RBG_16_39_8b TaxID=1802482 RepID=A0A1F7XGY1_9BACT|nr:MAG: hypothetical protein A2V80_00670 [Candidatus Woesebacteria bacterium RBG_16_39_8b]
MPTFIRKNPLFFVFIFPIVLDTTLTLIGQDASYWRNFKTANEMAPVYFILAYSPILFIVGSLLWYIFLYWLVKKLREPLNLILALSLIVGHTVGSSSWIRKMLIESGTYLIGDRTSMTYSWLILVGYFMLVGIIGGLAVNSYIKDRP